MFGFFFFFFFFLFFFFFFAFVYKENISILTVGSFFTFKEKLVCGFAWFGDRMSASCYGICYDRKCKITI